MIAPCRAVTFDLFDTLVEMDESRLPRLDIDGGLVPTPFATPFRVLRELSPAIDPGDAFVKYIQARSDLETIARTDPTLEFSPHTLFARWLEHLGAADEDVAIHMAEAQMQITIDATRVANGAIELLAHLRECGLAIGLISNMADARGGRELLAKLQLNRCLDSVVFSGDVACRKPAMRIFHVALESLGVKAEETLHVGDELQADIFGAGQCGIATVWINAAGRNFEGRYPPVMEISNVSALAARVP